MTDSAIATAADYADAMIVARKAKNTLVALILAMLLSQIALFFVVRYGSDLTSSAGWQANAGATPSTAERASPADLLKYIVGFVDFLGVIMPLVLGIVLFLMMVIMLVGRLIGVSRLVSAFIWCVVLGGLLFPWQSFLSEQSFTTPDFKPPGVLYNWAELSGKARRDAHGFAEHLLFWARFVAWPIAAIVILLWIQYQSRLGLRIALGEVSPYPLSGPESP